MVVSANMLVCLAHGSNDVANAIAPLIVVADVYDRRPRVPFYIGGTGISLGMICLGYKVMTTVGTKVVKLDYAKGFCAQFSVACCIIMGSILKIPLSTTHCMVGALFGIIAANKMKFVQRAYGIDEDADETQTRPIASSDASDEEDDTNNGEDALAEEKKKANAGTVIQILIWWSATLPVALGVSALLTYLCLINAGPA